MASSMQTVTRQVKPLLSLNPIEARRKVFSLYKAWIRQIPYILQDYEIPKNDRDLKLKIRDEFLKHAHIRDIRVIDMLVIKVNDNVLREYLIKEPIMGQMELKEVVERWKNKGALMFYFKDTVDPKPTDFLSKFMSGNDP